MIYFTLAIIMICVAVGLFTGSMIWGRQLMYTDADSADKCSQKPNLQKGECAVYEDNGCWKGSCDTAPCKIGAYCDRKDTFGPASLAILSFLAFIFFIIFLVIGLVSKKSIRHYKK